MRAFAVVVFNQVDGARELAVNQRDLRERDARRVVRVLQMCVGQRKGQAVDHIRPELVVNHLRHGPRVLRVVKQVSDFRGRGSRECAWLRNLSRLLATVVRVTTVRA